MQYLTGKDYPHLCTECRATIDRLVQAAQVLNLSPTDPEAPCDYAYDHALFCGGRSCKGPYKRGDVVNTIWGQTCTLVTFNGGGNFWHGKLPDGSFIYPDTDDIEGLATQAQEEAHNV